MNRIAVMTILLLCMSCNPTQSPTPTESTSLSDKIIIEGTVLDVHMLGEISETTTVCHFDPRFVVVIKTPDQEKRLAIHSPTQTFFGEDPIGKKYRFIILSLEPGLLLEKAERIEP